MQAAARKTILRIELWHGILLLVLFASLGPMKVVDSVALLLGGIFMGVNFFLLSLGVSWALTPLAGKGRVKAGIGLLALKIVLFLGLLTTVFYRWDIDAVSFALGFSTLIVAIFFEAARSAIYVET
jgi:hypothetical protein